MPSRSPIRAHYNASTVVFYSDVKVYREFVTSIERYCDVALTNHNDAVITVNTVRPSDSASGDLSGHHEDMNT